MAVRIEKILCTVIHEAYKRQVEETMQTLSGVRRTSTGRGSSRHNPSP
jgi:hypothetical protein